jgi:hypothetical protein
MNQSLTSSFHKKGGSDDHVMQKVSPERTTSADAKKQKIHLSSKSKSNSSNNHPDSLVVTVAVVQEALQRIVPNNEAQRGESRCVILSELEFRKFLHVGNGNPERTAQRILTYWTERKRIFGNSGGNHSPLEPSSLMALSNTQPLDQGFLSIITASDNHNENKQQTMTVLFLDERQMKNKTPMDAHDDNHNNRFFQSVQQCVFYVLANAASLHSIFESSKKLFD